MSAMSTYRKTYPTKNLLKDPKWQRKHKQNTENYNIQANERFRIWAQCIEDESLLNQGSMALKHPSLHNFRTDTKKPNFYVRNYQPSTTRCTNTCIDFNNAYLQTGNYNSKSPHNTTDWVRKLQAVAQSQPRLKLQSANASTKNYNCQMEGIDGANVAFPKWRNPNSNKWQSQADFKRYFNKPVLQKSGWDQLPIYNSEPYTDGFEVTGDISRKRNKTKELSTRNFDSTGSRDIWNRNLVKSQSTRSYRSKKFQEQLKGGTGFKNYKASVAGKSIASIRKGETKLNTFSNL